MNNKAFTIVELLIVIGITTLLAATTLPIYHNFQLSSQLNENTVLLMQTIRTARQNSISRVNNSAHGVKFQLNSYVLYQGSSYASRNINYDREVELDDVLKFSLNLGGPDEISFSEGLGLPDSTGTVTLTHGTFGNRTVNINSIGKIEEQ